MSGVNDLVQTFVTEYKKTPAKLKVCSWAGAGNRPTLRQCRALTKFCLCLLQVLDAFMVYALLTAAVQVRAHRQTRPAAL